MLLAGLSLGLAPAVYAEPDEVTGDVCLCRPGRVQPGYLKEKYNNMEIAGILLFMYNNK